MKYMSVILIIVLFTCVLLLVPALSSIASDNTVSVIYFIPKDRQFQWELPTAIDAQMKKVQLLYAEQMMQHGYGEKTFDLHTYENGNVAITPAFGQHNDVHYHQDAFTKILSEISTSFDLASKKHLIVADISTELIDTACGWGQQGGNVAIVPASGDCIEGESGVGLIAHELGHTFNLIHDFRNDTYVMSYGTNRNAISPCAAAVLHVHPYFNDNTLSMNTDATAEMLTSATYPLNAAEWTMRFDVTDSDGLYHVQLEHEAGSDGATLAECQSFENTTTATIEFSLPTDATAANTNQVRLRIFDQNGHFTINEWTLTAKNADEPTNEQITFLTLSHNASDTLIPTRQQFGYLGDTWEKTPDGNTTEKAWYFIKHPYISLWEHWVYAHAPSRIVYNIAEQAHTRFECLFYLPNPCPTTEKTASVQVICLADDTEIFRSEVLVGKSDKELNRHELTVDIPAGTQIFTIEVSEATHEDRCDHFVIGNPRLFYTFEQTEQVENLTDINGDGIVNVVDLILVAVRYGETMTGDPINNPDVNRDGIVDIQDIILVSQDMPPIATQAAPTNTSINTALLPNYPNPFNPETWIPYQLAKPSDVTINIYNASGQIARQLEIGYQQAGRYITQSRAAYWDGKNDNGERMASGVYFYELQTETASLVKRMLLLK